MTPRTRHSERRVPARAFTLLELLVTISIVSVLIGLTMTAVGRGFESARMIHCQSTQREVVRSFQLFADDQQNEGRGEDESLRTRFRLATFQDKQYGVDEFWRWGSDLDMVELPTPELEDPMRCAEVHGEVTLRRGIECLDGAITPSQRMSYGFNRRLHRAEYTDDRGRVRTKQVYLTQDVLTHPGVPLLWDVDAVAAAERNVYPGFSAPSLGSRGAYGNDRFWQPAYRHGGAMNVAFMDGSVQSTRDALSDNTWRWAYQPIR